MATPGIKHLVKELDQAKRDPGPHTSPLVLKLLGQLERRRFRDAGELAAYHEALLFIRAYPVDRVILRAAEKALSAVPARVRSMEDAVLDLSPLDEADMSGIFGTSVTGVFSYPVAAWLSRSHAAEVTIDWYGYEDEARLAQALPRFLPLLADETLVEAHFPYLEWLEAAAGPPAQALPWLIERISSLDLNYAGRAELYDSLKLYLRWKPAKFRSSRTGIRFPYGAPFYQAGPLLQRREVSLPTALDGPPLPFTRLSVEAGAKILELIRQTSAQRYRELHGFSYGDPASFLCFDAGRGIDLYVNETLPDHRLPLRGYHSGFMVKNGVPVGYVEGLSLFDRMEIGFNIYYTFREGESAYLYAKVLQVFHQLLGINCFSVDPYQIGHENEEGLASGAFWFYRKLGFQPTQQELLALVHREEKKIAARQDYRTPLTILAKIAEGHVFYDHAANGAGRGWSNFQVRNIGLAVQRRMAKEFKGSAEAFKIAAATRVARALGVNPTHWSDRDQHAFANWSPVLYLIDDLADWPSAEKRLAVRVIRAKGSGTEAEFLSLMQTHQRMRDEVIAIGSNANASNPSKPSTME